MIKLNLSDALLFLSLVCFAVVIALLWQRYSPVTVAFSTPPKISSAQSTALPVSLTLGQSAELPILPGVIYRNSWPVNRKGLIYLSSTPVPGQAGNSVIYGHNWPNLLGSLKDASPGEKLVIRYADGSAKEFRIHSLRIVDPHQIEILNPTPDARITLYTCTGFLDTKRLVALALPV